jgi:hypothetical protein
MLLSQRRFPAKSVVGLFLTHRQNHGMTNPREVVIKLAPELGWTQEETSDRIQEFLNKLEKRRKKGKPITRINFVNTAREMYYPPPASHS